MNTGLILDSMGLIGAAALVVSAVAGWARVVYWRTRAEDAEATLHSLCKPDRLDIYA